MSNFLPPVLQKYDDLLQLTFDGVLQMTDDEKLQYPFAEPLWNNIAFNRRSRHQRDDVVDAGVAEFLTLHQYGTGFYKNPRVLRIFDKFIRHFVSAACGCSAGEVQALSAEQISRIYRTFGAPLIISQWSGCLVSYRLINMGHVEIMDSEDTTSNHTRMCRLIQFYTYVGVLPDDIENRIIDEFDLPHVPIVSYWNIYCHQVKNIAAINLIYRICVRTFQHQPRNVTEILYELFQQCPGADWPYNMLILLHRHFAQNTALRNAVTQKKEMANMVPLPNVLSQIIVHYL